MFFSKPNCIKCRERKAVKRNVCAECAATMTPEDIARAQRGDLSPAVIAAPAVAPAEIDPNAAYADLEKLADTPDLAPDAPPAHGLGDKIAAVAKAFGFVQVPGCGCAQRQANLNYINFNQSPIQVAKDMVSALRVKKGGG